MAKIVANNCIVLTNGDYVPYCSFTNCIITSRDSNGKLPDSCLAHNCIGLDIWGTPNCFENIVDPSNVMIEGTSAYSSVFKTWVIPVPTGHSTVPSMTETFELTETAAATYLGDDGTQVGIYGGTNPFNPTPSNPQVKKFTVNSTTEGDQLKVKINVE